MSSGGDSDAADGAASAADAAAASDPAGDAAAAAASAASSSDPGAAGGDADGGGVGEYTAPTPAAAPAADPLPPKDPIPTNAELSRGYNDATINKYLESQVNTPTLPTGSDFVATQQQVQPDEFLDPSLAGQGINQAVQAPPVQKFSVSDQDLADILGITPATYQAFIVAGVEGEVDPRQLLTTQLANLYKDFDQGTPAWAAGAIRHADQTMLKRGLGASTMAGAAISQAIMEVAVPIASYDAKQYGDQNLQNQRFKQEALVSNQAAINAASQFNATTTTEVDKFISGMRDRIVEFNVAQKNDMEKFDVTSRQLYDKMNNESEKFVNQNSLLIAKSDVEWRRAVNTANTVAINAENQIRAQNKFNMSADAVSKLHQKARDLFHWANTVSENDKDRNFKMAYYNIKRSDLLDDRDFAGKRELAGALGGIATGIIDDIDFGSIFSSSAPLGDSSTSGASTFLGL